MASMRPGRFTTTSTAHRSELRECRDADSRRFHRTCVGHARGTFARIFPHVDTSSLKLDSALCVFVGVVAAAQYGLVAWLYWDEIVGYYGTGSPIPALGYPMRFGMLLVSGIAAGLVAWLLRRTVIDTVATATAHAEIVRLFGEHVSPGVVAELLARPSGDWSEVRPSAVLVADGMLKRITRANVWRP